mgnify:CR=1 FL=1
MTVGKADLIEARVLDAFWSSQDRVDRVELLQWFARLVIPRPDDWDRVSIRRVAANHQLSATECFCCRRRDGKRDWHHVIQIQNGGSNYVRNRVALCARCHARVHPWLPAERQDEKTEGLMQFKDPNFHGRVFAEMEIIVERTKALTGFDPAAGRTKS